jgi:CRP-like cAMP-binding protein
MSPDPKPALFHNHLLRSLSASDLEILSPNLSPVDLDLRQELEWPNKPIKSIYFPERGIASIVARGAHRKELEIGMFGREGMSGMMVVLGNDRSPNTTFVQLAGHARKIEADALRSAMQKRPSIRDGLLRFAQAFMIQASHTAISNGSSKLEERLARWLLMAHDRIDGDELALIHDFLARMLGVRRSGVTVAIHSLEAHGLIKATRGNITLLDRAGLENVADASYGVPEAEYARLTGQQLRKGKGRAIRRR